jgi:hypothetical protein
MWRIAVQSHLQPNCSWNTMVKGPIKIMADGLGSSNKCLPRKCDVRSNPSAPLPTKQEFPVFYSSPFAYAYMHVSVRRANIWIYMWISMFYREAVMWADVWNHSLSWDSQKMDTWQKSKENQFYGSLYNFHRARSKEPVNRVSHIYSPQIFSHVHECCLKYVFWTGFMIHVIKHLPSMHKIVSSFPKWWKK